MQTVFAIPGKITVKGREFQIPAPTSTDLARIRDRMRELARRQCVNPLLAVNAIANELAPHVLQAALEMALAKSAGGGVEPTPDAIAQQFETLEGVRFQLWYLASRIQASLKPEDVAALVLEEDRYAVADAIFEATKLGEEKEGPKA